MFSYDILEYNIKMFDLLRCFNHGSYNAFYSRISLVEILKISITFLKKWLNECYGPFPQNMPLLF